MKRKKEEKDDKFKENEEREENKNEMQKKITMKYIIQLSGIVLFH